MNNAPGGLMIVVNRMFTVTAAPAVVLGYLTDFGNSAQWHPATRQVTRDDTGPLVPGASWRQVCRILGVTAELAWTLVATGPDRLVFHGRNEGITRTDHIVARPGGRGTDVAYHAELEMHGLAKLATPILRTEFEKIGMTAAAVLAGVLDRLGGEHRSTELGFAPPRSASPRSASPRSASPRGQEA